MCSLKPVKKLIVPNKKCLKQYFLKREIKTLSSLCFPICHLFTCWTWAIHLDRALTTKFSVRVSKWDFKIHVLWASSDLLQHQYIIPLEYKCFSRRKKKSKGVVLQISHIEDFPVMPSGLKQTYFGGLDLDNLSAHARRINVMIHDWHVKQETNKYIQQ